LKPNRYSGLQLIPILPENLKVKAFTETVAVKSEPVGMHPSLLPENQGTDADRRLQTPVLQLVSA